VYNECGLGFGVGFALGLDSESVWDVGVLGWSVFETDRPTAMSLLTPCTPSLMPSSTALLEPGV